MLHLDTQKGTEATKMSIFHKYFGETAGCTKRLIMATKGCGQLTSNYTYFSDRWFSGAKSAEEVMAEGVNYFGTTKTRHKGFCLATLEKLMKHCPGGSYPIMEITPRVPGGRLLMEIGYK